MTKRTSLWTPLFRGAAATLVAGLASGCQFDKGNGASALNAGNASSLGSFLSGATPGAPGGPKVKGIWLAENVEGDRADAVVEKALQHGFNTLLPNIRYTSEESVTHLARVAAAKGIDVQLWLEEGIKFVGGYGADPSLFMPCSDGGSEHGVEKQYLDVRKPEARRFFVQKAVAWARIPGVSALQYDDHVGYFLSKLPCARGASGALSAGLDQLVKEASVAVKQANPRIRFEFSHHNAYWAQSNFAVNWPQWLRARSIDGMYTQAYTSANVGAEISKAKASGVKGLGLQNIMGNDQSGATLLRNTASTLQAGLGVIYFKWPKLNDAELTRLRQMLGGPTNTPATASTSTQTDTGVLGEGPTTDPHATSGDPLSTQATASDVSPSQAQGGIDANVCRPEDIPARRVRYHGYCPTHEGDLEANFDGCERSTCQASGGGLACTQKSKWSRSFFCRVLVPKIVGSL